MADATPPRDCSRNAGFISAPEIPEDLWVAGAIIITLDENANYGFRFVAESMDEVPSPEVQETIGRWAAQAFALANDSSSVLDVTEGPTPA